MQISLLSRTNELVKCMSEAGIHVPKDVSNEALTGSVTHVAGSFCFVANPIKP
jgi:hypothetical protein